MTAGATLRVRESITKMQNEWVQGNKKPLDDLMRAWKGIKDLPADNRNSFVVIGGYHGEPFRGAGWGNSSYWGGYCNHGNVLFPTWHRAYLLRLEDALRSIPGCENVTLPFWDECSPDSLANGIPWALTQEKYTFETGEEIDNPLRSFTFPRKIVDHLTTDSTDDNEDPNNPSYTKPKGYITVRYPLSGIVGTKKERAATKEHNDKYGYHEDGSYDPGAYETCVKELNKNVVAWLTSSIIVNGQIIPTNVHKKYEDCLNAPNYTVFSNTTSAAEWNGLLEDGAPPIVPLEAPHNSIHLAVGGFDTPNYDRAPIPGANGDMGENDTAGLDPIFFFHHCFVDRVFWLWQKRHGCTEQLKIKAGYPGTNSVDSQGPTPGTAPNSWLTLESPLDPFLIMEGGKERACTSNDCVNIEKLGYTYGAGSFESQPALIAQGQGERTRRVHPQGISRSHIRGSFLISLVGEIDGNKRVLGTEAVLSRWHVDGCANCQTHLLARPVFSLHGLGEEALPKSAISVEVHTRDEHQRTPALMALAAKPLNFDVR
jgi:tyrosinase